MRKPNRFHHLSFSLFACRRNGAPAKQTLLPNDDERECLKWLPAKYWPNICCDQQNMLKCRSDSAAWPEHDVALWRIHAGARRASKTPSIMLMLIIGLEVRNSNCVTTVKLWQQQQMKQIKHEKQTLSFTPTPLACDFTALIFHRSAVLSWPSNSC